MSTDYQKLDNPIWNAVNDTHRRYSINFDGCKFYHPDYCPFGSFIQIENTSRAIDAYADICNNFFLVGERPQFSKKVHLKNELICNQMIIERKIDIEINEKIHPLSNPHATELFNLVNLVQPGYFRAKTMMLGNYYGIFKADRLVAVTGERMAMNELVEVSAVVTHPDFTGRGYAKQLVTHTVNEVFNRNKSPFLHVAETNITAISLYERLGFNTRRKMSFWNFILSK